MVILRRPPPSPEVVGQLGVVGQDFASTPGCELEGKASMKIKIRLPSLQVMAVSKHHFLLKASLLQSFVNLFVLLQGKPQVLVYWIGDGDCLCRSTSWRHSFWSSWWTVEAGGRVVFIYCINDAKSRRHGAAGSRWQMCHIGLARGRIPSGSMVASMAILVGDFSLAPWRWIGGKSGRGELWNLCTRHFLWILLGSQWWRWPRHKALSNF
jgi:hypothetical protein